MQETPVVEINLEWCSWAGTVDVESSSQTESEDYKITLNGLRVKILSTIDVV